MKRANRRVAEGSEASQCLLVQVETGPVCEFKEVQHVQIPQNYNKDTAQDRRPMGQRGFEQYFLQLQIVNSTFSKRFLGSGWISLGDLISYGRVSGPLLVVC